MFWTALDELKSPENAGMIVRSHVAFGGEKFIVIGKEPWQFKKRAQSFSRRLEQLCAFWHCFVSKNISVDMNVLTNDGSLTMVVMDIRNIPAVSAALARAGTARRKRTSKTPDKVVDSWVLNLPTKPGG